MKALRAVGEFVGSVVGAFAALFFTVLLVKLAWTFVLGVWGLW